MCDISGGSGGIYIYIYVMSVVVDNMEASEMQEDSIARHKPKRGIAEKLINFTEDEEQQYEEQSDPEETFVKP